MDGQGDRRGNPTPGYRRGDFGSPRKAAAKKGDLKAHLIRYWLTPPTTEEDEHFEAKVADICTLYRGAPALAARGERVVSTDVS